MRRVLFVLVLLGALLGQSVMPAAAQTSVGYRFHVWHDGNGNGVLDASGADTDFVSGSGTSTFYVGIQIP